MVSTAVLPEPFMEARGLAAILGLICLSILWCTQRLCKRIFGNEWWQKWSTLIVYAIMFLWGFPGVLLVYFHGPLVKYEFVGVFFAVILLASSLLIGNSHNEVPLHVDDLPAKIQTPHQTYGKFSLPPGWSHPPFSCPKCSTPLQAEARFQRSLTYLFIVANAPIWFWGWINGRFLVGCLYALGLFLAYTIASMLSAAVLPLQIEPYHQSNVTSLNLTR